MNESKFTPFSNVDLPSDCRHAYNLAREAHQLGYIPRQPELFPALFHPVAMAQAMLSMGYGLEVAEAALLHDLVESTPVNLDHIEKCVSAETFDLVYDLSPPEELCHGNFDTEVYFKHLNRASETAQIIKATDLLQTMMAVGNRSPLGLTRYIQNVEQCIAVLDCLPATTNIKLHYILNWLKRREHEFRVNHYQHTHRLVDGQAISEAQA